MNRNRYRLVFDKRTGTLIPVAEFTASAKKGRRVCAATVALACWGGLGVPLSLAQTVPDPSSGMTVTETANGTELVNIVNPDASGLSHNKATTFNVPQRGTVLNNSMDDSVSTIGGYAMKNPHLSQHASAILMEVTGANRSRLEGTLEVHGRSADVLIANENGLYLNGAVFTNTSGHVTLTTGRPTGGRVFDIHDGDIELQGDGLQLKGLTHADLVARSMQLHGSLSGEGHADLHLVAGLNTFDAATGAVTRRDAGGGADAPAWAIDGSAVAMHGRHVTLVSTESGLGVRHEGIVSSTTDIEISVDGDLRVRTLNAGGDATVAAAGVSLGGADLEDDRSTNVGGTFRVDARGDLLLDGNHEAQHVRLAADGTLVSNGLVLGRRSTGTASSIQASADAMTLVGGAQWKAAGEIDLAARHAMLLAAGSTLDAMDIALVSGGTLETASAVKANGALVLGAGLLVNRGALDGLHTQVSGRIDNSGSLTGWASLDVALGEGESRNSGRLFGFDGLSMHGPGAALVNSGEVLANEVLMLDVSGLRNEAGGVLWAREMRARMDRLDNAGGFYAATLDITSGWLRNAGADATLRATDEARFDIAHDLENTDGGKFLSARALTIDVDGNLRNDGSMLAGTVGKADAPAQPGTIALRVGGHLDNHENGLVDSDTVTVDVEGDLHNAGSIRGHDSLSLDARAIDNAGQVYGYDVDVTTQDALVNRAGGSMQAARLLEASVGGDLANVGKDSGFVASFIDLDVTGRVENLDGALVQATHVLSLKAAQLANRNARLMAGTIDPLGRVVDGDMALTTTTGGDLVNDAGGQIVATRDAWLKAAGNVHNGADAGIAAHNVMLSATGDLSSADTGAIEAVGLADLRIDGDLRNDGRIAADGVWLEAANATNGGRIVGGSWIYGDTHGLDNRAGTIEAKHEVEWGTGTFANTGTMHSDGYTTLTIKDGGDLLIDGGAHGPTAGEVLTLNANDVRITHRLENPGHVVINATGDLDNRAGILTGQSLTARVKGGFVNDSLAWAATDIRIAAASMRNTAGSEIEATDHLWLEADGTLVNEAGARIAAGGQASIDAQDLRNEVRYTGNGVVQAAEERGRGLHYNSHNQYELLMGREYWDCGGACRENHGAGLAVLGSDLVVTAQGQIEAGGALRINQGKKRGTDATVFNQGLIQAGGNLLIDGDVDNVGIGASESIEAYLKRPTYFHMRVESNLAGAHASEYYDSLYALLDDVFSGPWTRRMNLLGQYIHADQFANALKAMIHPQLNMVVSRLLGASWKGDDYDVLVQRWNAAKNDWAAVSGMEALANRGPEIMAGATISHTGGHFHNSSGAQRHEDRSVTVTIGDQEVTTIDGHFDVLTNLRQLTQAVDPTKALEGFLADRNGKFRPAPDLPEVEPVEWATFPPATGPITVEGPPVNFVPVRETDIAFIDQSKFYGSDYWARQVGFQFDRTVLVIADNYGMNELINKQVEGTVGGFIAARDGVVGADRSKLFMDNAGLEGPRLGLQPGVWPTDAQLAQLTHDIVWLVPMEVDGRQVFFPQVFLSPKTVADAQADRAAGGATVAAGGDLLVDADAGGVLNHSGTLRAGRDVDIRSQGTVENIRDNGLAGGGLQSGEYLIIEAEGDVTNRGGSLQAEHVHVDTRGDFTDVVRMGYDRDGSLVVREQSEIRGGAANGSVTLRAQGNVDMAGSDVGAHDVRVVSERGNVTIRDVHEVSSGYEQEHAHKNLELTSSTRTTTRSSATSTGSTLRGGADGGSLSIVALEGDVVLQGGDYSADFGRIQAGGDVITRTGQDYTHEKETLVAHGLSTGARTGALGANAAAHYGPTGATASAEVGAFENPEAAGGKSNASAVNPGKAPLGEAVGASFGYESIERTTTTDTVKNHNAQLAFGSGLVMVADGTVDIGGVDIRVQKGEGDDAVKGDVAIRGAQVKSTKFEDEVRTTTETKRNFVGLTGSASSSLVDAASKSKLLADKAAQGMSVDPAMTSAQAAGDASNLVFNDVGAVQGNFAVQHSMETSSSTTRTENTNTIVGNNIVIQSTDGDIDLAGVQIDGSGGNVTLDSARNLNIRSARTEYEGSHGRQDHQVTVGASAGAAPTGAGVGISGGYNGSLSETTYSGTMHANSSIVGGNVTLQSNGDTSLHGANVVAGSVNLAVRGNMDVRSVQDTHTEETVNGRWGGSGGASFNSNGGLMPMGAADAGGGRSWDNSALTNEQSGIRASTVNGSVGGDLTQQGAHLIAQDGGHLAVAGRHVSEELRDTHDADGWSGGGGGGLNKNGTVTVNVQLDRDDQVKYESVQHNTVSGITVAAEGGTQGTFNTDADNLETVLQDERVAGNSMSLTVGLGDIRQMAGKRGRTSRGSADVPAMPDTPAPSRRSSTTSADIAPPRADTPDVATAPVRPRTPDAETPARPPVADPADVVLRDRTGTGYDDVTYERGDRLAPGVGKPVDANHVQRIGDLYLVTDDHGRPTNRYAEVEVVDGVQRFVEAGRVNRINERPATLGDVRALAETHEIERESSIERPVVGGDGLDVRVFPKRDYDIETPVSPIDAD